MKHLRYVHMAAESCLRTRCHETTRGIFDARNVLPALRLMRTRVHKKAVVFLEREGKLGEKFALRCIEPGLGPIDGRCGDRVHAGSPAEDRRVMVAEEGLGTSLNFPHYRVDSIARVGAIADVIAEKDETLDTAAAGVAKARVERLAVCMNVAEQPDPHISLSQ